MSTPDSDPYQEPYTGSVSFRQVMLYDLTSFLSCLVFLFVVTCTASIFIGIKWLGMPPPRESAAEILLGLTGITAVVVSIIRYRIYRISRVLNRGTIMTADIVRGLAYQFFVQIQVRYTYETEIINTILWLPNTKGPRMMSKSKQLTMSVESFPKGTIIVRNLYL